MGRIGYHASHERFAPSRLLENVKQAEAAGFQAAMCSDHFHPWSEQQGQSGFTWSWLGAAMASTNLSFGTVSARIWKMCREMNEMWSFSQCAMAWMRVVPNRERGLELVKMEFRSFLGAILLLPAQIIRTGRKIIYRILGYNGWIKDFFATWERLRRLEAT